jgi:hypothetical protein
MNKMFAIHEQKSAHDIPLAIMGRGVIPLPHFGPIGAPPGHDPVNPGRVHGDHKVRRVNDETFPAFTVSIAGVQRPCELDDSLPFFGGVVCCGIFWEACGFGVEGEEQIITLSGLCAFDFSNGVYALNRVNY